MSRPFQRKYWALRVKEPVGSPLAVSSPRDTTRKRGSEAADPLQRGAQRGAVPLPVRALRQGGVGVEAGALPLGVVARGAHQGVRHAAPAQQFRGGGQRAVGGVKSRLQGSAADGGEGVDA